MTAINRQREKSLTQERLKELFNYNPETGLFIRLKTTASNALKGSVAGSPPGRNYIHIAIDGNRYAAHRLAFLYMNGAFPVNQVDHKKHIKKDNRWSEMREATNQENGKNRSLNKNNKSGASGVRWNKSLQKWLSTIRVNGNEIYLGCFPIKEDAIKARKAADKEYGFHENHGS